jgi:hypothetical protein
MISGPIILKALSFVAVGFSFYGIITIESMSFRKEIKGAIIILLYFLAGVVATVVDHQGFGEAWNNSCVSLVSSLIYASAFSLFLAAIRPLMSMSRTDIVSPHPKSAFLFLVGVLLIALGPKGFLAP